jgi:hypothetical protein
MTDTYTTKDFVEATGGAEFINTTPGAREYSQTFTSGPSEEFSRFSDLAAKLIAVPKTEIGEG